MSGVTPRGNSWALGLFVHSSVDDSDLTVYEFRVYAHLCRRAGDERRVWEGQKKIAAACQMSRAAAQKALYGLKEKGWIELHEQFRDDGSQKPNDIIICGPPASDKGTPRLPERHPLPSTKAPEVNPSEGHPLKEPPPTPQGGEGKVGKAQTTEPLQLPAWIRDEQWADFLAHRKAIKKPLSPIAATRLLAELSRLRDQGQDVGRVMDQSIVNGWAGVFPVKAQDKPQVSRDAEKNSNPFQVPVDLTDEEAPF